MYVSLSLYICIYIYIYIYIYVYINRDIIPCSGIPRILFKYTVKGPQFKETNTHII